MSPPSEEVVDNRPLSPGANGQSLRVTIPPHHPGNPFVHSGPAISPPVEASPNSPQQSDSTLQFPTQTSTASLDLDQELPFGAATDGTLNVDFAEFDSENLNALEKIYLLSRSRAGFQRVYIAHALPGLLRSSFHHPPPEAHPDEEGEPTGEPDDITPAQAVEYVLPLLGALAADDGEQLSQFHR